ncbi:diaminopimelate epimerase [Halomicrococcus sp. NG-SE-24]|uniref:diaminopimelate epimerase n=1 Tax=Halomicrococcus sp. NG-SE-24 TaxID=3436928 RepID=UPI003D993277
MSLEFEKYHGTGNDFVVVDASLPVPDRGAFAREVCDRQRGIGADGVLFLALEGAYRPPRVIMTLVQPDGSTAAMCGNGARCAAHWAARRANADAVMIDTLAGTRSATVRDDGVAVEMGAPSFAPGDVPLAGDAPLVEEQVGDYAVTAVNTGVPHAVAFVDDVADVPVERDAPAIRNHDRFPDGANVTFASRTASGFGQRTFERGVEGETDSCGTGAVAIAAVARRLGLVDDDSVAVSPPGGDLRVAFEGGRATLSGPVEREFEGEIDPPAPRRRDSTA